MATCRALMPAVAPTTDLPRPFKPRVEATAMNALHRVLERNPVWYATAVLVLKTPPLYRAFTLIARVVKHGLFACRMCGQCALPVTAYACPMTCPKQLRNGPCGGVGPDGGCEVYPGMRCVWLVAFERADRQGRAGKPRPHDPVRVPGGPGERRLHRDRGDRPAARRGRRGDPAEGVAAARLGG